MIHIILGVLFLDLCAYLNICEILWFSFFVFNSLGLVVSL